MTMWLANAIWIGARISLVAMFPFSAIDKIWHWNNSIAQTKSSKIQVPAAPAMLVAAILVEGITPFCIVFGWCDRLAAFLLAGFCFVTAFLYHPFWLYPDFWSPNDDSESREHFWQFLKNFGLVGGLILVMFAGALAPPTAVIAHPFSSSRFGG